MNSVVRGQRRAMWMLWRLSGTCLFTAALAGAAAGQALPPQTDSLHRPPSEGSLGREILVPEKSPGKIAVPQVQEEEEKLEGDYSAVVKLNDIRVLGNTVLSEKELEAAYAGSKGRPISVQELVGLRFRLQKLYRERGFFLTRVMLPPQNLQAEGDVLCLHVLEGFISDVVVQGDADVGPVIALVKRMAERLRTGEPTTLGEVERQLLLMQDIPGISVRARFTAAPKVTGGSVLTVDVTRTPYAGFASIDNRGAGFAGPWQAAMGLSVNSFTAWGDRTEAYFFSTPDQEQRFGQVALSSILTADGMSLRLQGGYGPSYPGGTLGEVGFASDVTTAGGQLGLPMIRSRRTNVWLNLGFALNNSHIKLDTGSDGYERITESHLRIASLALRVNHVDGMINSLDGFTQLDLSVDQGLEGLDATPRNSPLTARPDSKPGFTRLTGRLSRRQAFPGTREWSFEAELSLAGQYAFSILPPSQKAQLGGLEYGRGYYYGMLTGDHALSGNLELRARRSLESLVPDAAISPYLFYDHGMVWNIAPGDPARRFLHSAGGGLRLDLGRHLSGELEYARRLVTNPTRTNESRLSPSRIFVRLVARY